MARRRSRSSKKSHKRRSSHHKGRKSSGLSKWRIAAQKHGYMTKGAFKPLPKKGSAEYYKIKATASKL